jgi:uncharacterized protein YegP (UPF0339 family)
MRVVWRAYHCPLATGGQLGAAGSRVGNVAPLRLAPAEARYLYRPSATNFATPSKERYLMATPKFEIYADAGGKFRWRLKDGNSQTVASSGESFDSKSNAKRAAENVKATAPNADIED